MNETSVNNRLFRHGKEKTCVNTGESRASNGPNMSSVGGRLQAGSCRSGPCYSRLLLSTRVIFGVRTTSEHYLSYVLV